MHIKIEIKYEVDLINESVNNKKFPRVAGVANLKITRTKQIEVNNRNKKEMSESVLTSKAYLKKKQENIRKEAGSRSL